MSNYTKGWVLAFGGTLLLSPDSLLIRLANSDQYSILALRSFFMTLMLLAIMAVFSPLRRHCLWLPLLACGVFYGVGLISFPLSLSHTYTANTLIIIATAPIFAAVGQRLFLGTKTAPATWLAMGVIFFSILLIFYDSWGSDGDAWIGDLLALITALVLAGTAIIIYRYQQAQFFPALCIGSVLAFLGSVWWVDWGTVATRDVVILAVDGVFVAGLPFVMLIAAAKRLPPAEYNLAFLLETALGPLWVWLVLAEQPPNRTLLMGGIIVTVLILHSFYVIRRGSVATPATPSTPA